MVNVLIVGDSQTGALLHRIRRHRNVVLAASPGKAFGAIHVTPEGKLTGYKLHRHCAQSVALKDFDLIYVYADLAEPVALLPPRAQRYSAAYLTAHIGERAARTRCLRLANAIARVVPKERVILIPKPLTLKRAGKGFPKIDATAATQMTEAATGFAIAHLKAAIYSVNWSPDPAYYAQSADWRGASADPGQQPGHDNGHLNIRGGSKIFDAFKADVARRLPTLSPAHGSRHKSSPPAHPTPPPPP